LEKDNAKKADIGGDKAVGSELDVGQIRAAYEERIQALRASHELESGASSKRAKAEENARMLKILESCRKDANEKLDEMESELEKRGQEIGQLKQQLEAQQRELAKARPLVSRYSRMRAMLKEGVEIKVQSGGE
jgi:chromosome segregation ATPase